PSTLSRALIVANRRMFWKVRAMPSCVIVCGLRPTIGWSRNRILPLVGVYRPASMFKNVVLPAPFGPIRLTIERSSMVKSTELTATRPPKRLVMPRATSRSGTYASQWSIDQRFLTELVFEGLVDVAAMHLHGPLAVREDALGSSQHQEDQRDAEDAELVLTQVDGCQQRADQRQVDRRAEAMQPVRRLAGKHAIVKPEHHTAE